MNPRNKIIHNSLQRKETNVKNTLCEIQTLKEYAKVHFFLEYIKKLTI